MFEGIINHIKIINLEGSMLLMITYGSLHEAILRGNDKGIEDCINLALDGGMDAQSILTNGLIAGMSIVSARFTSGEMFIPEVLFSAIAMHKGIDILKPFLGKSGHINMGKIIIGTVEGDIHTIGKSIVSVLLEGNGFEVIDIGVDVKADAFAQAIENYKPNILGMSALLTTTAPNMEKTINFLKEKGLRERVKIIIGGAPVDEQFAEAIGADGYAPDAGSAVALVKKLI